MLKTSFYELTEEYDMATYVPFIIQLSLFKLSIGEELPSSQYLCLSMRPKR